jgi:hypothetical protein
MTAWQMLLGSSAMYKRLLLIGLGQMSEKDLNQHGTADLVEPLLKQG